MTGTFGDGLFEDGTFGDGDFIVIEPQLVTTDGVSEEDHGGIIAGKTYLVPNNGRMWIRASSVIKDTTVSIRYPNLVDDELIIESKQILVPNGQTREMGPFPVRTFNAELRYLEMTFDNGEGFFVSFLKLDRIKI
jgi:hypothetical protein